MLMLKICVSFLEYFWIEKRCKHFPLWIFERNWFFMHSCVFIWVKAEEVSMNKSWIIPLLLILIVLNWHVRMLIFIKNSQKVTETITWYRLLSIIVQGEYYGPRSLKLFRDKLSAQVIGTVHICMILFIFLCCMYWSTNVLFNSWFN